MVLTYVPMTPMPPAKQNVELADEEVEEGANKHPAARWTKGDCFVLVDCLDG